MENKFNTDRKILLNNGMEIPCIGFGTYQIRKKNELENSVKEAYNSGLKEGKVKMIGVSNFCKIHLEHILKNCTIKPVINQIECNPIYWDKETIDYSLENNIVIEAYCPLAEWSSKLVENKIIVELAKKKNKTVPQIILKWLMQKNIIPLPKSVHSEYIRENFNLNGFCLTDEEMKKIDTLNSINYKVDWDPHGVSL